MSSFSDVPAPGAACALLSVIIPVWNDHEGLGRLLPQLLALPQVGQILISDDASDVPVSPRSLQMPELQGDPRIEWLRSDVQKGAGHARNLAFPKARGDWLLFFDSDDLPLRGLEDLLADLAEAPAFDFCIFSHVDSRMRRQGRPGPLDSDEQHWRIVDPGTTPVMLTAGQAAQLSRVSAYPWNKIYRTDFLRETGIRCTEIAVHNDVELHWRSFFHAGRILASRHAGAEHFVAEGGVRLTNRSGDERFDVFQALEVVHSDLMAESSRAAVYATAIADFYLGIFHWIGVILPEDRKARFLWMAQDFLRRRMDVILFTLIATSDVRLAHRLNLLLSEGRT